MSEKEEKEAAQARQDLLHNIAFLVSDGNTKTAKEGVQAYESQVDSDKDKKSK